MHFHEAVFTDDATISFQGARLVGGRVDFGFARFEGGTVDFESASGQRPAGLPFATASHPF
ncbi:pentapeptide repeat-containing protein [Actinomadura sp. NPDC048394]|uniref:pentapeptide repeat-containing protein n=1 Tax=Actinomadura sp. NPDC048394 TaxID=3158223 RepID=UPI0033FC61EB